MGEPKRNPNKQTAQHKPIDGEAVTQPLWQSDGPIVAMKQGNACGAKESTESPTELNRAANGPRTVEWLKAQLSSLTLRTKRRKGYKFISLAHMLTKDLFRQCFKELKRNRAPGIDRVSVEEYGMKLEERVDKLIVRLKSKRYGPVPVRRTYIPKSDGGKRPLGIPTVEDKLMQMAVKKILEPIFEPHFLDFSYGFRPNRDCHQALDYLDKVIMRKPVNFIIDMDIRKFFDTVDHDWMMLFLKERIVDSNFLEIIRRMLKAGVMEDGVYHETNEGTPQGGILSPLLTNIYLHYVLDLWFDKVVVKSLKGYASMVRYADDFIIALENGEDAMKLQEMLKERLAKFGLSISEEKSRNIPFGRKAWTELRKSGTRPRTFNFLGFTHHCSESRKGFFKLETTTRQDRFKSAVKKYREWITKAVLRTTDVIKKVIPVLRKKISGYYQYYGRSGNYRKLENFNHQIKRILFYAINRRSQRKSYNWEQFGRFLKYNPLPQPKIFHRVCFGT